MKLSYIITILTILGLLEAHKILVIYHICYLSHYNLGSTLAFELANRGHEVTFISPYPKNVKIKNLKEISLESLLPGMEETKKKLYGMDGKSFFDRANFQITLGSSATENTIKHPNVQKLLNSNEQFDLIVMMQYMNEAFMGFIERFNAPIVTVASMPAFSWASLRLAHPAPSSYVPNLLGPYSSHMTFWERFVNTLDDVYSIAYYNSKIMPKQREWARKYIPGSPDLDRYITNVSLVLLNSHPSIFDATPQVPNAIEIGGFHVKEPKPLPEELQKFLDNSKDGAIVFTLGSNIKLSEMDPKKRKALFRAFSKLKQNVLWKWETDDWPETAPNIKYYKWLPQNDVLAHPNVKLFITHGGLLSIIESIYHGVPFIGMPILCDQKMNMAHAVRYGYGLALPLSELTEAKITEVLKEILDNAKYTENVRTRPGILKDQLVKPLDTAIYWLEYVIRHKGAPHLRYAGMDLNWFQRNLFDVVGFGLFLLLSPILILYCLINKFCIKKVVVPKQILKRKRR